MTFLDCFKKSSLFPFLRNDIKVPLQDVRFLPNAEGVALLTSWLEVATAKALTDHCPGLTSCKKYITIPDFAFANMMREKSNGSVLRVDLQDPSTKKGVIEVLKNYLEYVATLSDCGTIRRKMVVNGKNPYL